MLGSVPEDRGDHLQALVQRPGVRPALYPTPSPGCKASLPLPSARTPAFLHGRRLLCHFSALSQGPRLLWHGDGGRRAAQKAQDGSAPRATPHGPGPAAEGRRILATEGGERPPRGPSACWFCVPVFSFVSCLLYKSGGAVVSAAGTRVTTTPVTESSLTAVRGVRLVVGWFLEAADRRRKEVRLTSLMRAA